MARVWIALVLLAIDLIGVTLLVRRRVLWSPLVWRWLAIGVGVVAAGCACLVQHEYTDKYLALGFPLPAAVFEISTGSDFVSPLTLPILCVDALLIAALPVAVLAVAVALRQPRVGQS